MRKYLDEINITDRPDTWNKDDERQESWAKEREDYGFDEREVVASGNAIIDYAIQYSDLVEIIRPKDLRNKLIDKINNIQIKYTDNK